MRNKIGASLLTLAFFVAMQGQPSADNPKATQKAIEIAHKLLARFDAFRDSPVFAQCGYGCGEENPGQKWSEQCKKISRQAKEKDVALPVQVTFENMLIMGRDYALGKKQDAANMRRMIESTLEDYAE